MGFLQGIVAKLISYFIDKILVGIKNKLADWGFKKKVEKKANAEKEAVLVAKNIINEKLKNGEQVLEEDYERLKEANRRFNSGVF